RRSNPNSRALLLDQAGFVGEASTANVVACYPRRGLVTPRFEKVLPGVSMGAVRDLASLLGIPFSEGDMTLEELIVAEEVWLTSTSVCMLPVIACSGRVVGSGQPGPMYQRLLAAWSED